MSPAQDRFFAIVNPAAGGGKSARLAGPALARLREKGLHIDVIASTGPGHAVQLAREAYAQGYRRFLAVGGDGTAHEILNGVFANRRNPERIALGFLPLGTGNSFLRDFTDKGAEASLDALVTNRSRAVDLKRPTPIHPMASSNSSAGDRSAASACSACWRNSTTAPTSNIP